MSKKAKVLVFHAKDTSKDAFKIQKEILRQGFQSITLEEFRSVHKGTLSLGDLYNLAINSHDYVICLLSAGLFANCSLRFPIGLAFGQNKVISAMIPDSKVILPTWYSSALQGFDKNFDEVIFAIRLNFQESE